MKEIIEPGFKLSLTHEPCFRFEENPIYVEIKGKHLKEMDVCWLDKKTNKFIILEIKSAGVWDKKNASKELIDGIKKKITDTLIMLSAIWLNTNTGMELKKYIPGFGHNFPENGGLVFKVLVDLPTDKPEKYRPFLLAVKKRINQLLEGRLHCFGVKHVSVFDFKKAKEIGIPIERHS